LIDLEVIKKDMIDSHLMSLQMWYILRCFGSVKTP